jgi:hypothetical protein
MVSPELWLYAIIGLVVALLETWLLHKAIKNTRRARLLARLPWSKIGQLQPGLVKVQGQALAVRGTLRSPLTGRECVYYDFQVRERRQGAAGPFARGTYWKTVINDAQDVPCALHDGTGSATVRLDSAELVLHPDADERSGFLNSARPDLEETLHERYGYSSVGLIFNRTLHYSETRIEEGEALVVLGTARQVPDGGWELVRRDAPLLVSDKGIAGLLASYRGAAFLWWCLAVLLPIIASVPLIKYWGFR